MKIAVFTVINALGAIHDRQGQVVRGNWDELTGERRSYAAGLAAVLSGGETAVPHKGNTTLTLAITNQKLSPHALRQVARQLHSSMAQMIRPFHTMYDGDVLYMVTTEQVDDPRIDPVSLGILATDVAWDAVLASWGKKSTGENHV